MAQRLGLSRNTINGALEQLAIEGYLLRSRQGTSVAPLGTQGEGDVEARHIVLPEYLQGLPAAIHRDSPTLLFTPGMPAVNYFPLSIWRRLLDRVLREEEAHYWATAMRRELVLRKAIARHLALSRGSAAKPARL
jgi:GntR family transcriptional regulator/MocR family aminotransferase